MTALAFRAPPAFVPPADLRPLWPEPHPVATPWTSPTFWLACVLVLPVALLARAGRVLG